jgi:hypothetical protein
MTGPTIETIAPSSNSTNHHMRKPASSFFSFGSIVCAVCRAAVAR